MPEINEKQTPEKANVILIVLSFFIFIVGVVLYFVEKSKSLEIAKTYLKAAIIGVIVEFVFYLL